jgi:hypothetical protein
LESKWTPPRVGALCGVREDQVDPVGVAGGLGDEFDFGGGDAGDAVDGVSCPGAYGTGDDGVGRIEADGSESLIPRWICQRLSSHVGIPRSGGNMRCIT